MKSTELVASSTLSSASSSSSASSLSAANSIASGPTTYQNSTNPASSTTTIRHSSTPNNSTPDITNSRNNSNSVNSKNLKTVQSSSVSNLSQMAHSTKAPSQSSSLINSKPSNTFKREASSILNDSQSDFKIDMNDEMFSEPMDMLDDSVGAPPPAQLAGNASNNLSIHKFFRNLTSSNDQAMANENAQSVNLHHDFYRDFGDIFDDDDLD